MLYHPAIIKLKEMVQNGELGRIYYLYSQRLNLGTIRTDENVILSLAPHDVSVSQFIVDKPPKSVFASAKAYIQPDIEDVAFMNIEYENDIFVNIHVSWLDPKKTRTLVVVGSEKMAIFNDLEPEEKLKIYDKGVKFDPFKPIELSPGVIAVRYGDIFVPRIESAEPLKAEAMHFVEAVQQNKEPRSNGKFALNVLRILVGAIKSVKKKHKVEL